jgi:protein-S-isoprenylcysteine O-methyltransferase Ste14
LPWLFFSSSGVPGIFVAWIELSASILLFALVLFLFLHLLVVYVEEPGLESRFGEGYRAYKQSVNRWLPRVASKPS